MDLEYYRSVLEQAGVVFEPGLSNEEVERVEDHFKFRFPPDYKAFLMHALPISEGFVDWRNGQEETIRRKLNWPFEGICYDIQWNNFWLPEWGKRPETLDDAFTVAKIAVARAPALIPIYSHRYIPELPAEAGNPIFSVYQTDIIVYGNHLSDYLENEFFKAFGKQKPGVHTGEVKEIPFWTRLVMLNNS